MTARLWVFGLAVLVLAGCSGDPEGNPVGGDGEERQTFQEFIDALISAEPADRGGLIDEFMVEASRAGIPFLEGTLGHFIYRGVLSSGITVPGDFNGWSPVTDPMIHITGTDFYYLTKTFESDARLDYKFVLDGGDWILDPLNPSTVPGGFGANSELAMPDYVQPEEINYIEGIDHGTIEIFSFHSSILMNNRDVYVYLPPGYTGSPTETYPTLYVNDGGEYLALAGMDNVLDFLHDRGDIQDMIAVFVDPVNRNTEYWLNSAFKEMMVDELVPHIDSSYRTLDDPSKRGIMGASLGGLVSVYIAYEHPDVFGFCAGQSGAFWVNSDEIIQMISSRPQVAVGFYLDWGTYEAEIAQSNYDLRDALIAKGYTVTQFEYHEGHSWGSWRAHTDDILKAFVGKKE